MVFNDASDDKHFAPLMMRIMFKFDSADSSGATILAIFFDPSGEPATKGSNNVYWRKENAKATAPTGYVTPNLNLPSDLQVASSSSGTTARAFGMVAGSGTAAALVRLFVLQECDRVEITTTLATTWNSVYVPW